MSPCFSISFVIRMGFSRLAFSTICFASAKPIPNALRIIFITVIFSVP